MSESERVHTIINGKPTTVSRQFFDRVQEFRSKRNLSLLEELPPPSEPDYAPAIPFVIILLILIALLTFFFGWRALSLDEVYTVFHWMGIHRAIMMPVECLLALGYGMLS